MDAARPAALRAKAHTLLGKAVAAYALARAMGRDTGRVTKKTSA